jgi:hypothetical protein
MWNILVLQELSITSDITKSFQYHFLVVGQMNITCNLTEIIRDLIYIILIPLFRVYGSTRILFPVALPSFQDSLDWD